VDGVNKTQQRVLTAVGAVLGLLVAYFVFNAVIGNRMIEAPRFVFAVLLGGAVGMIFYTLIKDGGVLLLKRQQATKDGAPPAAPVVPEAEPEAPQRPIRAERPVRAAGAERPVRAAGAERPVRAERAERPLKPERPLRPRDRS
jgi:hypothetical protein